MIPRDMLDAMRVPIADDGAMTLDGMRVPIVMMAR
jgi:hypothetical protein